MFLHLRDNVVIPIVQGQALNIHYDVFFSNLRSLIS